MPFRKFYVFVLLLVLPACVMPGCLFQPRLEIGVQAGVPYALNALMSVADQERLASRRIIWRQGQSRFSVNGTPETVDPERSRLYTDYANRLETCCTSVVYSIPFGTFTATPPQGASVVITGNHTGVLRIFNADVRTVRAIIETMTLTVPPAAPRKQTLTVIFYSFWHPLSTTTRLEAGDYRQLMTVKDAFILPLFVGTRNVYDVILLPAGQPPVPGQPAIGNPVPELEPLEPPEAPEEPPPNEDGQEIPEAPAPADRDADGVPDAADRCPALGDQGYGVAQDGCPYQVDSDRDGITDYYDMCPNDGDLGTGLDANGCPNPIDSDGDGLIDDEDYCPYEGSQGNGVDKYGCPL